VDKKKKKRKNKKKKNKQGFKLPTTDKHVGKKLVIDNYVGSVDDAKITQTTRNPKYPYRICKGSHILKDCPSLSKVVEVWSTHPRQPISVASEQHADDLLSTSQDTVGKKKIRVKFTCMLCGGKTSIFSMLLEGEASMVSWHPIGFDLTRFPDLVGSS
jgi:hypothetical protein